MKNIVIFIALFVSVLTYNNTAFAINIGKPEPTEENLVIGYAYDSEVKWSSSSKADLPDLKFKQHLSYAQLNFVHNPFLATYIRLGGLEMTTENVFFPPNEDPEDFSPGTILFGTLGVNALLVKYEHFSLGLFGQYTKCEDYDQKVNYYIDENKVKTNSISFGLKNISWYKAGVGAQTNWGKVNLYGGVFYYGLEADASATEGVFNSTEAKKASYENETASGAFFGIRIPVDENFMVCFEAQQIDTLAYGISVNIKLD